jgi:hypothetical protein
MNQYSCPICDVELQPIPRYSKYVCPQCSNRAKSEDGRPLEFFNQSMSDGYMARYADSNEEYASHKCFIDDTECYADEAKFGGILIEVGHEPSLLRRETSSANAIQSKRWWQFWR